jgi:hypothetical protein
VEFFDAEWADCGDTGYDEDYPHLSSIMFALARNWNGIKLWTKGVELTWPIYLDLRVGLFLSVSAAPLKRLKIF